MAIVITDEDVVVNLPEMEAKMIFAPMSFGAFMNLPMEKGDLTHYDFMQAILGRLKSWEGVVDKKGKPVECSAENFKRIPGPIAMLAIKRFGDASGMTEEFEKNFGKLLKSKETSAA